MLGITDVVSKGVCVCVLVILLVFLPEERCLVSKGEQGGNRLL